MNFLVTPSPHYFSKSTSVHIGLGEVLQHKKEECGDKMGGILQYT